MTPGDPLSIECPSCGAPSGQRCMRANVLHDKPCRYRVEKVTPAPPPETMHDLLVAHKGKRMQLQTTSGRAYMGTIIDVGHQLFSISDSGPATPSWMPIACIEQIWRV